MKNEKPRTYDSLQAAAADLKLPLRILRAAKKAGCPAFRSNRVYGPELVAWLEENPVEDRGDPRDEKLAEEIRKLRMRNDKEEGTLISRAWVAERMQVAAGELNAFRSKSEAEHPLKFAAAAGDPALCRTIVRGIWDEIFKGMQDLSKHFAEGPKE